VRARMNRDLRLHVVEIKRAIGLANNDRAGVD
jgi:hypothetical protein